jgi:hypothetical protein
MKVIMVAGLPGSGKTTWAKNRGDRSFLVDDPRETKELPSLEFLTQKKYEEIVIVDPWFCLEFNRKNAEKIVKNAYGIEPEWVFFENDTENCFYNVMIRNDGRMVLEFIKNISKKYEIPNEIFGRPVTVLPVWKGN